MLSHRRPSSDVIRRFLAAQAKLDFSYVAVGATSTVPPLGYMVDHTRIELGTGEAVFTKARAALERWDHFRLGWVEAFPSETTIEPGMVVAVIARKFGIWSVNACRIVYVIDEPGPVRRYGFAYGTLPDHVETGEERFMVEWDQATGKVRYDILAFSRPRHLLIRTGNFYIRRMQKRFGRESAAAMKLVVEEQAK
jgi:uncharacterized protein (UPF0548 family)